MIWRNDWRSMSNDYTFSAQLGLSFLEQSTSVMVVRVDSEGMILAANRHGVMTLIW